MEDIVPEHQAYRVVTDEFLTYYEGLSKAVRGWLLGVTEIDAEIASVPKQALESRQVIRGRDDEDVPDAGQHEH